MRLRDLGEVLRVALAGLRRSVLRSSLTVLGLAIGVAAFIAMTSFGQGATRAVVSQFEELGANLVRIQSLVRDPTAGPKPARPLGPADVAALRRDLTTAARVVPNARMRIVAAAGGVSASTWLWGTTPEYFPSHRWSMAVGGPFEETDLAQRGKVCVLGATPATMLFGERNPVGATIALGDALTCHVIGVLAAKGLSTSGRDLDELVLVPISTYEAYIGLPQGYAEIEVEAFSRELVPIAQEEAVAVMRRTHSLSDTDTNDFKINTPTEAVKAAESVSTILTQLLATIAAVSLIVGGIGIMNIQLVAVAERTKEIGIRSAIGAAPGQIMAQFLAEAVLLSTIGALVGMAIGIGSALAVANAMHWDRAIDPLGVFGAAAFGIGAGVFFGYAPARRAARLDPIEALRQE